MKTKQLTPQIKFSKHWNFSIEFKLADMWIGGFWAKDDIGRTDIWVCLLPCLPIHFKNYIRG